LGELWLDGSVLTIDSQTPDGSLIAAALDGEEAAFALLARRYQPALLRAAISRLGRRELAEEAVQEALLCAHRWLATYDSRFSFRTWLWTILLNQCTRQAKREARHRVNHGDHLLLAATDAQRGGVPSGSPLDRLLERESAERLHTLLAELPESQADALRLRFFGGLTFPEIAAAMACSEPGAKNRVKMGLLKLAQWLRAEETPRRAERTTMASNGESLLGEKP
jgi:RNA polymerase sigma-70 factor (ECF subfamily)